MVPETPRGTPAVITVILGASNATEILKSGAVVTMDAEKGIVSSN